MTTRKKRILHVAKRTLVMTGILIGVLIVAAAFYIHSVNGIIDDRIEQLRSTRSTTFYSLPAPLRLGGQFTRLELRRFLEQAGFREGESSECLPGEFHWEGPQSLGFCLHRPEFMGAGHPMSRAPYRVELEDVEGQLTIKSLKRTDREEEVEFIELPAVPIASFIAGRVRTQNAVALSEMPVSVRHAVMAIEDPKFLEHHGVSPRGILRAFLKNIQAGRSAQGGSTITQQLMKNLFFSSKKAFTRKIVEAIFAFLTEMRHSKEAILEAYLNEIYLGQWSTHEIHGMAEGARYYFKRPISEITLSQSAVLAAIVQSPNSLDPRKAPDKVLKRRNLVLKRMLDADFILEDEYKMAIAEPLGVARQEYRLDDVDYFLDLVLTKLPADVRSRLESEFFSIYVTLNPTLQTLASQVLSDNIEALQKRPALAAKAKKGMRLQGALIAVDPRTCSVLALQGGRNYRQTQFNRVLQGKRQPGSLFKPFVALAALMAHPPDGEITPASFLEDSPFEWKYDKQTWKPKNYDGKFRGNVTVRQMLEESLNIPTARLTQKIGVPAIVDALKLAGIDSTLPSLPSLALGAADITPFELAEAYTTLANLGKWCELRPYLEIYDANGNFVFANPKQEEGRLPATSAFQTVNMLKGTFTHGTARSLIWQTLKVDHYAGKTGTTNEAKDAWFVGFSPDLLVLVWMGYDEEEKIGVTGSTAALPIWIDFMKGARAFRSAQDFEVPPGLLRCEVERPASPENPDAPKQMQVDYFISGTQPTDAECSADAPVDVKR